MNVQEAKQAKNIQTDRLIDIQKKRKESKSINRQIDKIDIHAEGQANMQTNRQKDITFSRKEKQRDKIPRMEAMERLVRHCVVCID